MTPSEKKNVLMDKFCDLAYDKSCQARSVLLLIDEVINHRPMSYVDDSGNSMTEVAYWNAVKALIEDEINN
jgi:hypothetical protein